MDDVSALSSGCAKHPFAEAKGRFIEIFSENIRDSGRSASTVLIRGAHRYVCARCKMLIFLCSRFVASSVGRDRGVGGGEDRARLSPLRDILPDILSLSSRAKLSICLC